MAQLYRRRIIDEIQNYIFTDDVVVLHGARQVGKTSILYWLKNFLAEDKKVVYYVDLEDSRFVKILNQGIDSFVNHLREEGIYSDEIDISSDKIYVFIDEIQYLEDPSSFLKLTADHYKFLKLIVTGSSSFDIRSKFKDSLVGRTVDFEIFNLSFSEVLEFKEYVFTENDSFSDKKVEELRDLFLEYVLYGGYPKIVLSQEVYRKEKYLQQIIDTYVRKDIRDLADVKDIDKFNKLVEVLASQSGNLLNITELSNTCGIAKQTVERYLFILESTYILKLVKPYHKNIRSELFKVPKIFFYDSGLMQMLWLKKLQKEIIGSVFETAVFSELIKKYHKNNVLYWRTADKKEIDFILRDKNSILPIEVKLNFQQFNLSSLMYFNEKYSNIEYRLVGLNGNCKEKFAIYPWKL
ncbi:MAG: ATP-binding protein [Candidatus Omnitrophica bacterium]|nr:ATP-binding protein [Candidatus Omnitrophota bacterium]